MNTELAPIDIEAQSQSLVRLDENPAHLMRRATDVAGVSRDIVMKTAMTIQGRKYVRVEGWQAIAVAHGCVASSRDVERVDSGFRAIGEVKRMSDGMVLATAEGFVGDDETNTWGKRPEYARRAMAQTRAISRACRSAFAHVVVLIDAQLSTTPAEEVPSDGFDEKPATAKPKDAPKANVAPKTAPVEPVKAATGKDEPWRSLTVPFGKDADKKFGDLPKNTLWWWCTKWEPREYQGSISENDKFLRKTLDGVKAKYFDEPEQQDLGDAPDPSDDVPF